MGAIETHLIYGLTIRESANDGSDFTNPAADYRRLFLGEDGSLHLRDSAGTVTDIGGAGGGGGLLAVIRYAPTSQTVYTSSGTAMQDVDASNMVVTFTAPASGNVLVRCSAFGDQNTASGDTYWGLRESTSNIGGIARISRASTDEGYYSVPFYVSGLTPGNSYTYKWAFGADTGVCRIIIQDGSAIAEWGPGTMEVWAAP